jgi:N-acetylglucosamine-6-phosphate deacetylase
MNKMVNGNLVAMTDAEIAAANADQDDYINNLLPIDVRNQRNALLAETDYMALSDVTMSDAWTAYRQALRDIPEQAGFPASVTWPTKPE